MTPYALFNLLSSGKQFVKPGEMTYEGMVIGEVSIKPFPCFKILATIISTDSPMAFALDKYIP